MLHERVEAPVFFVNLQQNRQGQLTRPGNPVLDQLPKDPKRVIKLVNTENTLFNKQLTTAAVLAGITKKISMHTARHTFAYLADMRGVSAATIQSLLDHGDLATTERYIRALRRSDELDKAVDQMWE